MRKNFGKLFERGEIGKMALRNRIVMAAMVTNFAGLNGEVTDRMIDYYTERAKGGVGLIITEASDVDYPNGLASATPLASSEDKYISGYGKLAEAIHVYDTKIAVSFIMVEGRHLLRRGSR
jgi:2,4-dienoyl-CoA reductase-like NADH-dependent reductase (Old Yellow Enzyme family)